MKDRELLIKSVVNLIFATWYLVFACVGRYTVEQANIRGVVKVGCCCDLDLPADEIRGRCQDLPWIR